MSNRILNAESTPDDVLRYWFGNGAGQDPLNLDSIEYIETQMGLWFAGKSAEFDSVQKGAIQLLDFVADEKLSSSQWSTPDGVLARVILLDQFTRCIFRGTAKAFQYDHLASQLVLKVYNDGLLHSFKPIQRFFLGVAIQHAEDIAMQRVGVDIANAVADGASDKLKEYFRNIKGYPMEHHDVVLRFGRFPSRNAALGRESTAEEVQWMASPDCPAWARSQMQAAAVPVPPRETETETGAEATTEAEI